MCDLTIAVHQGCEQQWHKTSDASILAPLPATVTSTTSVPSMVPLTLLTKPKVRRRFALIAAENGRRSRTPCSETAFPHWAMPLPPPLPNLMAKKKALSCGWGTSPLTTTIISQACGDLESVTIVGLYLTHVGRSLLFFESFPPLLF